MKKQFLEVIIVNNNMDLIMETQFTLEYIDGIIIEKSSIEKIIKISFLTMINMSNSGMDNLGVEIFDKIFTTYCKSISIGIEKIDSQFFSYGVNEFDKNYKMELNEYEKASDLPKPLTLNKI